MIKIAFAATCLLLMAADTPIDIYYQSDGDAEADLASFDSGNPGCYLWTNWQKLCSRTGAGGATECKEDRQRRVRPSRPFCIRGNPANWSDAQAQSAFRFCQTYEFGSGVFAGEINCAQYQKGRPFDPRHLAVRRHPWCEVWVSADYPHSVVCSEKVSKSARVNTCERRQIASSALVCGKWADNIECRAPSSTIDIAKANEDGIVIDTALRPDRVAAAGVFCNKLGM